MHLDRLEKAGLVTGQLELSEDGKAMKYFALAPFDIRITAETITEAVASRPPTDASDRTEPEPRGPRARAAEAAERHDNDESERQMTHVLASGTNYTAITIGLGIPVAICAAVAVIVWSYFRLQRHRADAVAMAHYRKLAEEAVANQQEMRAQLAKLTEHVRAVEKLMRDVG